MLSLCPLARSIRVCYRIQAFRTGKGLGWGDHHHYLFEGTERFFKPNYVSNLITNWIPALEDVEHRLKNEGSRVADVGCGHGVSTIPMAKAYPNAKIIGFDYHYHKPSIEWTRKQVEKESLQNIAFEVAKSTDFPGEDYDMVAFFDCFHDMRDLIGAAKHALQTLKKKDGTLSQIYLLPRLHTLRFDLACQQLLRLQWRLS